VTSTNTHRKRVDALHSLSARLGNCSGADVLVEALDFLFGPTEARAGVAILTQPKFEVVAERGLSSTLGTTELREAIADIAARAIDERRTMRLTDVREDRAGIARAGEIAAIGCTSALTVPLIDRKEVCGAFVLLLAQRVEVDEEAALFVETVAALVTPVLVAQEPKPARPVNPPSNRRLSIAQGLGGATLLGASVGHELEGPVGALLLQLEEQRRIVADLQVFSDGSDTPLGGAIAELAELTDELSATVARLRETTDQLTRLGHRELAPSALDLSEVARTACAVARPGFEERGIVLETQLADGGYVSGHRESIVQVICDLLTLARDRAELSANTPKVVVRTANESSRVVLSVDDLGPVPDRMQLRDFERRPFADASTDERRRLVLKLLGDVVLAHGGHVELVSLEPVGTQYRVILPAFGAIEPGSLGALGVPANVLEGEVIRNVLVVDDDPVFSRSARRAMKPHLVREANTASEAEIILSESSYLPDLVICDLMLPGADGTTLHRHIAERRPEVAMRFLFVTGGTLGKEAADYIRASSCGALRKPIDLGAVRRHLSNPNRDTVTTSIVRTLRQDFEA